MEMSHHQPQPSQQSQLQQRRLAVHRPTRLRSQSTPTSDGWVMPITATEGDQAEAMHMADDNHQHQHHHQHQHQQQHQQHGQPQRHENGGQKGKMDIGFLVSN
jgi:hypothetical protein